MKKEKKITVNSIKETEAFALKYAKNIKSNDIIALYGDLGVGKTVIAKNIGKYFKIKEEIVSPTFNIVKLYDIHDKNIKKIYHFDLYRIKKVSELENIGFEDYIYEDKTISIIEWPEIANDLLPKSTKKIFIKKILTDKFKREITYDI